MIKKILVAEDDEDIRLILTMILTEAGYHVEALSTGTSILAGRNEWPNLFILDKALPDTDGFAICRYLKLQSETRDIPIIMISSYHQLKNKARRLGVADFLEKPFNIKELLHIVGKHLDSTQQT